MKPKVYISDGERCPFLDVDMDVVICENMVGADPDGDAVATHVCSCEGTRERMK